MLIAYLKRKLNERRLEKQRQQDEADLAIWRYYHSLSSVMDVSQMTGKQFEEFLARLFRSMGYSEIRMTPSNDQGGDIVCISPEGVPTVIQAKRWNGSVGNKAVQEVLGAMRHYECINGVVVTNSTFTSAAIQLASSADVTLHDNRWLKEKINEFVPKTIPEFSREGYDLVISELVQITRHAAQEAKSRRKRLPKGNFTLTEGLRYAGQAKGKELTVQEVKELTRLHMNLSESDDRLRASERALREAESRVHELEVESAELDAALEMLESSSWSDESNSR